MEYNTVYTTDGNSSGTGEYKLPTTDWTADLPNKWDLPDQNFYVRFTKNIDPDVMIVDSEQVSLEVSAMIKAFAVLGIKIEPICVSVKVDFNNHGMIDINSAKRYLTFNCKDPIQIINIQKGENIITKTGDDTFEIELPNSTPSS